MRNVQAARCRIEGDVIPILLAAGRRAEVVFLEQVVSAFRYTSAGEASEKQHAGTHRESTQNLDLHLSPQSLSGRSRKMPNLINESLPGQRLARILVVNPFKI